MMTFAEDPVWCGDCYRRVQHIFCGFMLGGGCWTWTGHDPKCPRRGKAPK